MPMASDEAIDVPRPSYRALDDKEPRLNRARVTRTQPPSPSILSRMVFHLRAVLGPGGSADSTRDRSSAARHARLLLVIRGALGEFVATFFLVFLACSAGLVCHYRAVDRGPAVVINALTAGLTVSACVFAFYSVSGAHMNPLISLSLFVTRHVSFRRTLLYAGAQLLGGQLAMLCLFLSFQADRDVFTIVALLPMQVTAQGGDVEQVGGRSRLISVFTMETLGTFMLVFVNFKAAVDRIHEEERYDGIDADGGEDGVSPHALEHDTAEDLQDERKLALITQRNRTTLSLTTTRALTASRLPVVPIALAMGALVTVLIVVSQGSSGGGFNPARYVSSALWSGRWDSWWCWLGAEALGCLLACMLHVVFEGLQITALDWRWKAITQRRRQSKLASPTDALDDSKAAAYTDID